MARRILNVFLGKDLVGQLEQDASGSTRFEYSEAWLNLPHAVALSASLPLEHGKFHRNKTRPFFAGLLPEEQIRRVVAGTFGVSERNDFALLEKIGAECAGAVSLLPPRDQPLDENPAYQEIDEDQLGKRLQSLPQHPLLAGEKGIRLSLAGAQGKLALRIDAGRFLLPLEGSPSTHILKPENPRFPGLVENEFFCMRLADSVGLETARVEIGSASSIRFLQVERFDRRSENDQRIARIHQEDFCQALGVAPELKYEAEGGPGLKKMLRARALHLQHSRAGYSSAFRCSRFQFTDRELRCARKKLFAPEGSRLSPARTALRPGFHLCISSTCK